MARSRKRKGHGKRIASRKARVDVAKNAYQKIFDESIKKQIEELKKKQESDTGTTETNG